MADLSPPPTSSLLTTTERGVEKGWSAWFQENWERSFDGYKELLDGTFDNDTVLNITSKIDASYEKYKIVLFNTKFSIPGTTLSMRISIDQGETYDNTSIYEWLIDNKGSIVSTVSSAGDTRFELNTSGVSSDLNAILNGTIELYKPADSTRTQCSWKLTYTNELEEQETVAGAGQYNSSEQVNAVQINISSGYVVSGKYVLYGLR